MTDLKKTSLTDQHLQLKAKMAPFAGFEMPLQYTSVKEETKAVRNGSGVFDVSHMGEFFVRGKEAIKFVDYILTNDFAGADLNKAVYSPLCRENGTIVDDLIAYKLGQEEVLLCVNASNIEKDFKHINQFTQNFEVELTNESDDYSLLALQGPKSEEILKNIGFSSITDFTYYSAHKVILNDKTFIIARTGYTGEDGFEIFGSHEAIKTLWKSFLDNGVVPCGLAARDVLRLEVGYPLYGNELSDDWTPLDAGLKWTVRLNKHDFVGKAFLESYKPKYRLIKLMLEKGIPRSGYEVINDSGEPIGSITSGTMSVTIEKGIGLALVEKSKFPENKNFQIKVRSNNFPAQFLSKPFVTGGHK